MDLFSDKYLEKSPGSRRFSKGKELRGKSRHVWIHEMCSG